MDQAIRNKLRNVVTQCRRLLEEAVSQVLQGQFGIYGSAKKDEVHIEDDARMKNLSGEDMDFRRDIRAHLEHIEALGYKPKDALAQLVREIAFTHLNRLCAYKMMEAREVWIGGQRFREAVSRGLKSQGFQFYLADHPEDKKCFDSGHQDVAYRHFLAWLGALLSEEIGVLFSPTDPANRLCPPQRVLDDVLALLNSDDLKDTWSQDETIGWVYQYFTPKELRDQARKESAAPRNSYELAFRNQFFTPRYVVEFLTDNTLGRLWYEMRKGETRLKDQCRYLVRRHSEVFLAEGQSPPEPTQDQDELSQEELLKQPVHIPFRPKKDPRELRILDPACGSGHFLLYCFDLLLTIYEEAYADPDLGPKLKEEYPTLDALRRVIPRLILAHNLRGIDIDLRATQIAALALWLRCQRAYQEMGLKQDRPKITQSSFVCAEPMPGEQSMLKEFVSQLDPKLLGQLVEVVFEKMKLAGEAGSLLKIEEEIRETVADAKKQWVRETTQATDRRGQPLLFTEAVMDRLAGKAIQPSLFDLSDITDDQFFDQAETRVVEALRRYAEKAQNGQRLQRRLFTEDTVRGFAFIDLCRKRFDVVVMNPPFGEVSLTARQYLYATLPETARDLFAGFVSRLLTLLRDGGCLGVITNRTAFFSEHLDKWRKRAFGGEQAMLSCMADLGYGVLDAVVETAAYVCSKQRDCCTVFIDLLHSTDKETSLGAAVLSVSRGEATLGIGLRSIHDFEKVPGFRITYQIDPYWIGRLNQSEEHPLFTSKYGLVTGDDFRYLRCFWEVHDEHLASGRWRWFAKGGDFSRYRTTVHLMVDWKNREKMRRLQNNELYGRMGATYTERTTSNLSARVLQRDCVFSGAGPGVIPHNDADASFVLAYLNSAVTALCLEAIIGGGDFSMKGTAARHLEPRYLQFAPNVQLAAEDRRWFDAAISQLVGHLNDLSNQETDPFYGGLGTLSYSSLHDLAVSLYRSGFASLGKCYPIVRSLEAKVIELVGVPALRLSDLRGSMGYPLPDCTDLRRLPSGWEGTVAVPDERDESEGAEETERQFRFENKLSHYLHPAIEQLAHRYGVAPESICGHLAEVGAPFAAFVQQLAVTLISHAVGVVFGRWAGVSAQCETQTGNGVSCFDPIPQKQPARNVDQAGSSPALYCDDEQHHDDLLRHLYSVLDHWWPSSHDAVLAEMRTALGFSDLREYFRKSGKGGFWSDHISRYTKSRRKAPIYWLLQSSKKNYALWLYYHRLDKDILFKALLNYVEPKVRLEQSRLDTLRAQKSALGDDARGAKKIAKDIERQEALLGEIKDFEEKLRRAANLDFGKNLDSSVIYDPDLNDGVVLNIAPLWELVPWKEAKGYWDELLAGEYEWSSMGKLLRKKGLVK
jgi:hypothetical protein